MAESEAKKRPPYASAGDIDALFDRIKTMQAPRKIDAEWAATYNLAPNQPVAIPNLLKWLGVIDQDGAATPDTWDPIRLPGSRAEALAPLVRESYSDVFDRIDVEHATQEDLAGTFIVAYSQHPHGDGGEKEAGSRSACAVADARGETETDKDGGAFLG
jgi:hypothetical protein